jgi:hypothetical protein
MIQGLSYYLYISHVHPETAWPQYHITVSHSSLCQLGHLLNATCPVLG